MMVVKFPSSFCFRLLEKLVFRMINTSLADVVAHINTLMVVFLFACKHGLGRLVSMSAECRAVSRLRVCVAAQVIIVLQLEK